LTWIDTRLTLSLWLAFVGSTALILAVPGPTAALVLSRADRSKPERIALVCGLATGDMIAMTLAIAGLAAVLSLSALAFQTLKLVGGAYLVYLGTQTMRDRTQPLDIDNTSHLSTPSVSGKSNGLFAIGIIAGLLHPKTYLFFAAFLPVFINPEARILPQYSLLVITWGSLSDGAALLWTSLGKALRAGLGSHTGNNIISRLSGFVLITFGLFLIATQRTD